jgi:hypothetical protein
VPDEVVADGEDDRRRERVAEADPLHVLGPAGLADEQDPAVTIRIAPAITPAFAARSGSTSAIATEKSGAVPTVTTSATGRRRVRPG